MQAVQHTTVYLLYPATHVKTVPNTQHKIMQNRIHRKIIFNVTHFRKVT